MSATRHMRILLVEDSPTAERLFREQLNELSDEIEIDYEIDCVATLEAAIEGQERYELVICDLSLQDSGVSGTFGRAMTWQNPVAILTGHTSPGLAELAGQHGACTFIPKDCENEPMKCLLAFAVGVVKRNRTLAARRCAAAQKAAQQLQKLGLE